MTTWTVTDILRNNTKYRIAPLDGVNYAVWYGSLETAPQTVQATDNDGQAGKFRATDGRPTGTTGIVVYKTPDPDIIFFLLHMMPYDTGTVNETKVGFLSAGSDVDVALVERVWSDVKIGTKASREITDKDGRKVNLHLESIIEQGFQVKATFTLSTDD